MNEEPITSESARLLPHTGSRERNQCSQMVSGSSFKLKVTQCYTDLCIPSKAAILVIISALVVGILYYLVMGTAVALMDNPASYTKSISVNFSLPYALLAFAMIFYPLSGLIADVCCERRKMIMFSLCFLLLFLFMLCFTGVLYLVLKMHLINVTELFQSIPGKILITLLLISLLFFIIGLIGYQANFIQLGLDQLFEAPNHYLGLFIHYASWSFHLGVTPLAAFPVNWCNQPRPVAHLVIYSTPIIVIVMLIILVIVMRWKKH